LEVRLRAKQALDACSYSRVVLDDDQLERFDCSSHADKVAPKRSRNHGWDPPNGGAATPI